MKIIDIANEIYEESFEPTYTSIPAISFWIRGKIGTINSLLCEDFQINSSTLEINYCDGSEISIDAVAIIKQLYRLYDLQQQVNNLMNALASDSLLSVKDAFGGGEYTRVNKNSMAQTLISLRKDEMKTFDILVGAYKINRGKPLAVNGDDTISAPYWNEGYTSLRDV
jgi:hypothetical protein